MILAGLRRAESLIREEAEKMSISLDIRNNQFFQEAFHYGQVEGREEGRVEGQVEVITGVLETRFCELPEWARQKLAAFDQAALVDARKRMLSAPSLEDFFAESFVN
jgi:predicted transposase YdaD